MLAWQGTEYVIIGSTSPVLALRTRVVLPLQMPPQSCLAPGASATGWCCHRSRSLDVQLCNRFH